jgi:hypothetical protein
VRNYLKKADRTRGVVSSVLEGKDQWGALLKIVMNLLVFQK